MKGKFSLSSALMAGLLWLALCATAQAESPSHPDGEGLKIHLVEPGHLTDLVVLTGGLDIALHPGMVLSVFNDGHRVGELILTRVEEGYAVALISALEPEKTLAIGDTAAPKLRKYQPI